MRPVVQVAASREQEAAKLLGEAQREVALREARLNELLAYQTEYAARFETSGGGGLDMARLQDYRIFLVRLNEAIALQRRLVDAARMECEARRAMWLGTRQQAQAIDKAVDRFRRDEAHAQGRREQAEADERAQQGRNARDPKCHDS